MPKTETLICFFMGEGSKKRADGTYSERDLDKFPTIQPMPGKWAAFDPSAVEASQPSV